ncbi:hypothetical protein C9J03_04135 [Photobacterium gaetbulicola]|uniref:Capsular polysaccharide biosynthesis protein n=2 Tax=Photobacterium gaetbulicola TaxID=1295392 RepID=A0A0C5WW59_9GAMM|nr:hypothetical protein [Photobacterium gaetbulicola]AJR07340.1 hypothetical protein H744_2c0604 [Photobacterium gaetbulicola Gung47]KHT62363.1 hypothetical protein RJ45_17740 [Photobacterium gaetbulicola]PSU13619.1 hypothetical protein C9J03_04135 [Photobacterium gaetbulicola]
MKPWLSGEYEQLFHQIHRHHARVITLAGASSQCGTSTHCNWLARRCAEDHKVLLIDLDLTGSGQGCTAKPWHSNGQGEAEAMLQLTEQLTLLPRPRDEKTVLDLRQPDSFCQAIERWKQRYHYILCDVGTLTQTNWRNLPIGTISHASDATILCLAAAKTTESELLTCIHKLDQNDVSLLGTLVNDQYNPSLAEEIIRVLNGKARWLPQSLKCLLIDYLQNSPLLQGKYQ